MTKITSEKPCTTKHPKTPIGRLVSHAFAFPKDPAKVSVGLQHLGQKVQGDAWPMAMAVGWGEVQPTLCIV